VESGMTAYTWPGSLPPRNIMFHRETKSSSGGVSILGYEQVGQTDAGRWRAHATFPVPQGTRVLAWRAVLALSEGRFNTFIFGVYDDPQTPAGLAGFSFDNGLVKHSDGTPFSDGSCYRTVYVNAQTAAGALLRSTSLQITMLSAFAPQSGQYFSIGKRLYLIKVATLLSGSTYLVTFWPPLREAVAAAAYVEFDHPACELRLASDDTGELDRDLTKVSTPGLDLVEAFP
jgi:hypothetical protein